MTLMNGCKTRYAQASVVLAIFAGACDSDEVAGAESEGEMVDCSQVALDCEPIDDLEDGPLFTDITNELGFAELVGNKFAFGDLDGDSYPDLLVSTFDGVQRLFMNRQHGTAFEETTDVAGLTESRKEQGTRRAHAGAFADLDNDGDLDVMSVTFVDSTTPSDEDDRTEVFLNDGAANFVMAELNPFSEQDADAATMAVTWLDYDRDGLLDAYFGNYYETYGFPASAQQDRLFRGRGDGTFDDVTIEVGIETDDYGFEDGTNHRPTMGVTTCDVNGDGDLDLLSSAYGRQFNLLWASNGDGTFRDASFESTFAGDDNVDYTDNQFYLCYCELTGDCEAAQPQIACESIAWSPGSDDQPWRNGGNTFTTACGDVDNDGDNDLYNATIRHWWAGGSSDASQLLLNDGKGIFSRPGIEEMGLGHKPPGIDWNEGDLHATFLDCDADGRLDIFLGSSDYPYQEAHMFRQKSDGTFEDVAQDAGIAHPRSNGMGVADIDRDGDLDIIVGSSTARCSLEPPCPWTTNEVHVYRNDLVRDGKLTDRATLELKLIGAPGTARDAIGARVTVTTGCGSQSREVQGTFGHDSIGNEGILYVGLAGATRANLEVRWPNADFTTETFCDLPANSLVVIEQGGEPVVTSLPLTAGK